jgi:hypothetical protein
MLRTAAAGSMLCALLLTGAAAGAEDLAFAIDLTAKTAAASKTAHADVVALGVKPKDRGMLEAKAGERVTVQWTLRNADPKTTYKDVTVHFFAAKEEKAGQHSLPKLDRDVAAESALTMDFKPKDSNEGELSFTIDKPGTYLLRVETLEAAQGPDGREYFAAIDLVVR